MSTHPVVSRAAWLAARTALLAREKEFSKARDEISRQRRELPWVQVDKEYVFETPDGPQTLEDLFAGRNQLFVYHFMFGPGWEKGCTGCSFLCDHVDAARQHFERHDVKFVAVSRAPLAEFTPFKERMGWTFDWFSSFGSDFNYDYGVSFTPEQIERHEMVYNYRPEPEYQCPEQPGLSAFYKDEDGTIFHTYSTYARGLDILVGAYNFLDLAPLGRNETGAMSWVRLHDEYEAPEPVGAHH
jgi:predicted dithiol-disulfide oxidoreductase (DUF899 family)